MYDLAMVLNPDNYEHPFNKAMTMLAWKGDLAAAREIFKEKPLQNAAWHHIGWIGGSFLEPGVAEAVAQAQLVDDGTPVLHAISSHVISSIAATGYNRRPGFAHSDRSWPAVRGPPGNDAQQRRAPGRPGQESGPAGQNEAAVQEAKLAVDLTAKDVYEGPEKLEDLAKVYATVGRHDEAVDLLARLLKTVYESSITLEMLELDPDWDPLREHPRFKRLFGTS